MKPSNFDFDLLFFLLFALKQHQMHIKSGIPILQLYGSHCINRITL